MMNPNQPDLSQIRFEQTSGMVCEKCHSMLFSEAYILRIVSRFLVPSANKDQVIPVPVFYCINCNHVQKEFLPPGVILEQKENEQSTGDQ